jgi:phosphoribosylanthranilate isomerase
MHNRVRVKICGITSAEDALAAVEAGADALGFMFYPRSSRYISLKEAAGITSILPPFVTKAGVFVDASREVIAHAVNLCHLDVIQLHGAETPEMCAGFSRPVVKAFRIAGEASLEPLPNYKVSAWLLDSYVPGQLGGTGARFNWDLAVAASRLGRPVILAGGLTPENVAEAVRQTHPFAVDVSSGVESAPGRKDPNKLVSFIRAVCSAR